MVSRVHGNDDWWRDGDVLSFLFFAAELSSAFSFLIFVILAHGGPIVQQVVWLGITASLPVLLLGCSMLLPIAVSAFPNAASGVFG
ncbi:TPA: hypothetical protein RQK93_003387 [Vibrio vulnificus]|nr:hypothetical protein [Vibrio vulnificus]HDY8071152.1 hypothetical protein [Vibrio vulnificus]